MLEGLLVSVKVLAVVVDFSSDHWLFGVQIEVILGVHLHLGPGGIADVR